MGEGRKGGRKGGRHEEKERKEWSEEPGRASLSKFASNLPTPVYPYIFTCVRRESNRKRGRKRRRTKIIIILLII